MNVLFPTHLYNTSRPISFGHWYIYTLRWAHRGVFLQLLELGATTAAGSPNLEQVVDCPYGWKAVVGMRSHAAICKQTDDGNSRGVAEEPVCVATLYIIFSFLFSFPLVMTAYQKNSAIYVSPFRKVNFSFWCLAWLDVSGLPFLIIQKNFLYSLKILGILVCTTRRHVDTRQLVCLRF